MGSLLVVASDPGVQIDLQFGDRAVDALSEGDPVELVQHRLVEALDDSIRLRVLGLGTGVIHVLNGQVQLVLVMLGVAAILRAAVRQHAGELHLLSVVEGHDAVIQQVGRGERRLTIVELGEGHLRVGVDEGLLVDAPDPLHVADVEGVLGAAIARALALELAVRLLLGLGLFERGELALGQNETVLRDLRLERLEALLHGLEIVALPHAADAGRGDGVAALTDLVGYPDLAKGRLLQRQLDDDCLDLERRTVR